MLSSGNCTIVKARKYSYVASDSNGATKNSDDWVHFPMRSDISLVFLEKDHKSQLELKNLVLQNLVLQITWKSEKLDEICMCDYMSRNDSKVAFFEIIGRYPSVGIKCKNPVTFETSKRLQLSFESAIEYELCLNTFRMWGINARDSRDSAMSSTLQYSLACDSQDPYWRLDVPQQSWNIPNHKMNYQGAFSLGTPDSQSSKILAFSQTQQDIPHTIFPEVPKFSDEFSRNCFADIFDHDISVRQDLKHVDHSGSSIAKQIGVTEDLINEDLDLAIEMTLKNPSFKELVVKLEKKLEDSVFK